MDGAPLKTVVWVGPSRKDLREFPRPVQRVFGYALNAAQLGETPPEAKVMKGFGTPQKEIELIRARLRWAERIHTGRATEG